MSYLCLSTRSSNCASSLRTIGGSSLSAVRLAVALDRVVSLRDVTRHPVLADLAALVDRKAS